MSFYMFLKLIITFNDIMGNVLRHDYLKLLFHAVRLMKLSQKIICNFIEVAGQGFPVGGKVIQLGTVDI